MSRAGESWARATLDEAVALLATRTLGRTARAAGATTSTMSDAADWAAAGAPDGSVILAATQSDGRGRAGRTWHDLPGASLLFSLVLRAPLPPELLGLVPLAAGVAVARGAEAVAGVPAELKWPNDVMVGGRKVAGVLAEGRAGALIVGVGVNVAAGAAPAELADRATTLEEAAGRPVSPARLLAAILDSLEPLVDGLAAGGGGAVREEWESRMHGRGATVTAGGQGVGAFDGVALGLAPDGALRLATPAGERLVYAGDVSLRPAASAAPTP